MDKILHHFETMVEMVTFVGSCVESNRGFLSSAVRDSRIRFQSTEGVLAHRLLGLADNMIWSNRVTWLTPSKELPLTVCFFGGVPCCR